MVSKYVFGTILSTILAGAFLFSFQTIEAQSICVHLTNNLGIESSDDTTGGDVTKLQRFLGAQDDSIYPDKDPEGFFGVDTKLAVYRWQKSRGIKTAGSNGWGFVDEKTRAEMAVCKKASTPSPSISRTVQPAVPRADFSINECTPITRDISRGSSGTDVVILQKFLTTQYGNFYY